jgi:hypothetical protein
MLAKLYPNRRRATRHMLAGMLALAITADYGVCV